MGHEQATEVVAMSEVNFDRPCFNIWCLIDDLRPSLMIELVFDIFGKNVSRRTWSRR